MVDRCGRFWLAANGSWTSLEDCIRQVRHEASASLASQVTLPSLARMNSMAYAVELILARQLASGLSVPVLVVDARGDTLFYNEPAESIFGRHFDDIDALPFEERANLLAPRRENGEPLPVDLLPGMMAMRERRPAHAEFYIHGLDGVLRPVEATAVPIESAGGHVLGAMVVMWQGHMAHF
ncbi:MAG: PAS domain-containing protein [Candidatus Limnocylindria bacterium]